jgi:rod shape-determining protein MreD
MNALMVMTAALVAAAAQAQLPSLPLLGGVRVELLPALVAYAALTLPARPALACAVAAGGAQDAFSAGPFGLTAMAYATAAWLVSAIKEQLLRDAVWMQMSAGALSAALAAAAGVWAAGFSAVAALKLVLVAGFGSLLAPVVFAVMDPLLRWAGRAAAADRWRAPAVRGEAP